MNGKNSIRKTLRWTAVVAAALLIWGGALLLAAQTDSGRQGIARILSAVLSEGGKTEVRVGKGRGVFPFRFELDFLSMRDEQGLWLELRGLLLDWSPLDLLRGIVRVRELQLASIHLERLPGTGQTRGTFSLPLWAAWFERLKVEHLAVGEAILGQALLGERAVFRGEMNLMAALPEGEWITSLRLERSEGPYARLIASAKLRESGPALTLDLEAVEAPGGLFSRKVASGTEAVSLSLHGEGSLAQWRGRVEFRMGEGNFLRADLSAGYKDDWHWGMEGVLEVNQTLLPVALAGWVGRETRFSVTGGLREGQSLVVDRFSLETGDLTLGLSGSANLRDKGLAGRFTLLCRDLKPLGGILKTRTGGTLRAEGDLRGTFAFPGAAITFSSRDLETGPVRLPEFGGEVSLDLYDPVDRKGPELRLKGRGEAQGFSLGGLGAFPEKTLRWELIAEELLGDVIRVRDLGVGGESVSVRVSGDVDPAGPSTLLTVEAQAGNLRPVSRWLGAEFPGAARLKAGVKGTLANASLEAGLKGSLNQQPKDSPLAALLGGGLTYEGRLILRQGRELALPEIRLSAAAGSLAGSGLLDLNRVLWNGAFQIRLPDLGVLTPITGTGLAGTCTAEARMEGSGNAARMAALLQGEEIRLGGGRLGKVSLTLDASGSPLNNAGSFRMALGDVFEGTEGKGRFAFSKNRLALSEILLSGPGRTHAGGELAMDFDTLLGEGRVSGRCEDLSGLSALLGERLGGTAEFAAEMSARDGAQQVSLSLKGERLDSAFGKAETLDVRARLRDVGRTLQGSANVKAKGLRHEPLTLSSLGIEAEGGPGEISFTARGKGTLLRNFEGHAAGLLSLGQGAPSLALREFQATFGDLPIRLEGPGTLTWGPEAVSWDKGAFRIGDGRVSGSGSLGERRVEVSLHLQDIPLEPFVPEGGVELMGRATGELRMTGDPRQPDALLRLSVGGLRIGHTELQDLPPGKLEARGELKQARLHADFSLGGFTVDPVTGRVEIPLNLSLSPFHAALRNEGKIEGKFNGTYDLARLAGYMGLSDQALGGSMQVDLTLGGTAAEPGFTGGIEIRNGTYENARTGTILRNGEARLSATQTRLILENARATDGESGVVSGKGWLSLSPSQSFPFELALAFQKTKLLRQDWASATAGGDLELKGTLSRSGIRGNILIEAAEIRIPERFRPDTTDLEVVEINRPESGLQALPVAKKSEPAAVDLDLTLKSPGRVLLTGHGLESEWAGDLRITGSLQEPVLNGGLSVVRGRFDFLGKRFTLKEGKVTFNGTAPPSPFIDALAEANTKDMIARVRLQGALRAPQIRLSSDPAMPTDEVLSRLLFGRSASRVSALQAVQLVQALNLLAGGNTLDLMGQTRRFLRVDQLDVKQTVEKGKKEEDTSIAAGKYLHDNVYLEVEKGLGPKGDKASLDWEITPHISIETDVGTDAERGIGLNWKWDY